MVRKSKVSSVVSLLGVPEWDRNQKDPWHIDFEKENINDDKWTCIVTAAVQSEAQDGDCIQIYTESVNMGLRKAVKIISMADVVKLLQESVVAKTKKEDRNGKPGKSEKPRTSLKASFSLPPSQVVDLAVRYSTITDTECKIPPDLLAGVLKFLILQMKEESCLQKRVQAVRERKRREKNIKARFIREKKQFEVTLTESKVGSQPLSETDLQKPINDEPLGGPDLYIMLVDFYDVSLFPEMLRINIPFVALLKISTNPDEGPFGRVPFAPSDTETMPRKNSKIDIFWERLKGESVVSENSAALKNIAMMQYVAPPAALESNQYRRKIFDELTWMQYSAHCIYRQHQKYLQEMHVQRLILSLERLELSKCRVYNKLCDALITGEPLTPVMVLYAIVEQVVAGVPETESKAFDYIPQPSNFFFRKKKNVKRRRLTKIFRGVEHLHKSESFHHKHKESIYKASERASAPLPHSFSSPQHLPAHSISTSEIPASLLKESSSRSGAKSSAASGSSISEDLIDEVLNARKSEKEQKADKKWKTPVLCPYGDSVFSESFYCDPRLFNAEKVIHRFMANSDFFDIWQEYPELPPEERAYYNYHFLKLWKISEEREDILKLKLFFTLSTKLIGITKSYLNRRQEENISEIMSNYGAIKPNIHPKVKFEQTQFANFRGDVNNFSNYFFKTFIAETFFRVPRKTDFKVHNESGVSSMCRTDSQLLLKVTSHLNIVLTQSNKGTCFPCSSKLSAGVTSKSLATATNKDNVFLTLSALLECFEISNVTENESFSYNDQYLNAIKRFKFYEKLEPKLMIQRVLEAGPNFNTIQCTHFRPTDTLIITMYDDFDHRGMFYSCSYGALPTPVALRDFYNYVYPEISNWLVNENEEHSKFMEDLAEKIKAKEEKEDAEYLAQLRKEYREMSSESKFEFLLNDVDSGSDAEITEKHLGSLPIKPRPNRPKRVSFVTTNVTDVRIENNTKTEEFHSRDGTKVTVTIENWLYNPLTLLKLEIKRSNFLLYYNQWLGQETNTAFTFKTISDIIFSFYTPTESSSKYDVTISWPTGLLIRPVWLGSSIYLKQNYLQSCRSGWRIEDEDSRCFLKNGQIVIFKTNGDYDVLSSSGTKYSFCDSATGPRYEIVSTTGEVWEIRTKGPCRSRRKLLTRNKIFIGVDPKTQELFCRREDGMQCMLWQNGRLVTSYPDGTKITAIPYFDEEIYLDWTEEERIYFEQMSQRCRPEQTAQDQKNRTILRNSGSSKASKPEFEGFISISCTYLMEHPRYATVFINPSSPYLKVQLPENLSILIDPEGTYEIQQEKNFLRVYSSGVEFQTICHLCDDTSTVKLNFDSSEILCSLVDFFRKSFFVLRSGETTFKDISRDSEGERASEDRSPSEKSLNIVTCTKGHTKPAVTNQRCFALERNLSGVEFLHEDCIQLYTAGLPDDTYYEHNPNQGIDMNHTFSSYYSKAGYEKWVMDYEDQYNSIPVNIKKKDLKELGAKQVARNLFHYPFPKPQMCGNQQQKEKPKINIEAPKFIVTRVFLCLSPQPDTVINDVKKYVSAYQKQAQGVVKAYKDKKSEADKFKDYRYVEMRLRKIALALNKSLQMFPHMCTQLPSTEKDIHYFGHFINYMKEIKGHTQESGSLLPNCKHIPALLPRSSEFPVVYEESDDPKSIFLNDK